MKTQQKTADGRWVNYNSRLMFAGRYAKATGGGICGRYWSDYHMRAGRGRLNKREYQMTGMVQDAQHE